VGEIIICFLTVIKDIIVVVMGNDTANDIPSS
jgi:hypothetical protein